MHISSHVRILFAVLALASAASCNAAEGAVDASFKPAQGWILLTSGRISEVEASIRDYPFYRAERPGVFRVELHAQSNGAVALVLPDGFPAYDLTNLMDTLSYLESVDGAACWITAPGNGVRYFLEPETGNPWGDTLIGASSLGHPVRVSLPETGLSEVSSIYHYRVEPAIELVATPTIIEISLETSGTFGNPSFVINSPKDHDWRW